MSVERRAILPRRRQTVARPAGGPLKNPRPSDGMGTPRIIVS